MKTLIRYVIYWPAVIKLKRIKDYAERKIIELRLIKETGYPENREELDRQISHLIQEFLTAKDSIQWLIYE